MLCLSYSLGNTVRMVRLGEWEGGGGVGGMGYLSSMDAGLGGAGNTSENKEDFTSS